MFRRALLSLLPAVAALAFMLGVPAYSAGDGRATAWANDSGSVSIAKGALGEESVDITEGQWSGGDQTPEIVVKRRITSAWPPLVAVHGRLGTAESIFPSHSACAFPPRAPPAA